MKLDGCHWIFLKLHAHFFSELQWNLISFGSDGGICHLTDGFADSYYHGFAES